MTGKSTVFHILKRESHTSIIVGENNASENWGGGALIWASLEVTSCSVKNESVEGTKVRNDCGVSDWVRRISAKWLRVVGTKMERATGIEEASDSENGDGSGEDSES